MEEIDKKVAAFKDNQRKRIDIIKANLSVWIDWQNGPVPAELRDSPFLGPYSEINAALLETAIDRMLALLGGDDTKEFVLKAYDRRMAVYRKSLL